MDAQLREFYGPPQEEEQRRASLPRMAVRGGAAAAGAAGLSAAYVNRKKLAGGLGAGMEKAGGYLRNQGLLTKNVRAGSLMHQVGKKMVGAGGRMKMYEDVDTIIDLAARVAEMELEAEEEVREFGSVDQWTRRGQGMAASVLNKKRAAVGKLVKAAKENPRTAGYLGGVALVSGVMAKRAHDKAKRREELLARFKGKQAAEA